MLRFIFVVILTVFATLSATETAVSSGSPFGRNLVVNSSFEDDFGSLDIDHIVKPTDWSTDGYATVVQYGGLDGLPTVNHHDESIVALGGRNFFVGGPERRNDVAKAWQRIDLADAVPRIQRRSVRFELSAALGGRAAKADFAKVWVRFFDAHKQQLAAPVGVEPVLRADRRGKTRFVRRACYDSVPAAARYVQISVGAYRLSGAHNHAYVDDVAFILRDGGKANPNISRCIASGPGNSPELLASARMIDDASRSCVNTEHFLLALMVAMVATLMSLAILFGDKAPAQNVEIPIRIWGRAIPVRRGVGSGVGAVLIGVAVLLSMLVVLWRVQALSYAECGLQNTLVPQPWTFYPALFCALLAFNVLAAITVFVHWHPLHPKKLWRRICIRTSIFLTASLVALAALSWLTPTTDELDRITAVFLILTVPLTYMWLALRESIPQYRAELKWGIVFLLILPIMQPGVALWNLHVIKTQRIHHEIEHRYFDVGVGGDHVRFSGVLFYAPTALDYRESGRVVFSAHLSHVTDKSPHSCLRAQFNAPGFAIQTVAADAVPLVQRDVRWEWIVTPRGDGRQFFFVDAIYSPACRLGTSPSGNDGATLLFSQTDSAWVSRQWFSVEDLMSALPWISFFAAVLTIVVGVLDVRAHSKDDDALPLA